MDDGQPSSTDSQQLRPASFKTVDSTPQCHFLNLPTELRQEIFKYLVTNEPIDSLTMYKSDGNMGVRIIKMRGLLRTQPPTSLTNLLLGFNRETYEEVKDVFYKKAMFKIDISRDGAILCGRRILGPSGRDGLILRNDDPAAIDRFIQNFPWSEVKNYIVNISVGRPEDIHDNRSWNPSMGNFRSFNPRMGTSNCDTQVELYDLRDYVAVIVSGVLAKARQLHNLQVSLFTNNTDPPPRNAIEITHILTGPFERLRRVRNPRLTGLFRRQSPVYASDQTYPGPNIATDRSLPPIIPDPVPIFAPGIPAFDSLSAAWQRCIASEAPSTIIPASPMTKLFVEFKDLYNKLASILPGVVRHQAQCFLHRARVAREQEDIATFRAVSAELMACWRHRLQVQEVERQEVGMALQRVLDADCYPREEGQ